MDLSAMRPGQQLGVSIITQRVIERQKYTTIVLPTRYGKSDVIRASALKLFRNCKAGCSLVLSPNAILRDQMVAKDKVAAMVSRYRIKNAGTLKVAKLLKPQIKIAANGEFLVSCTTQLVDRNTSLFADWIEHMVHTTGLPVLVYVDECHTGSEDNSWGQTVESLVEAGGHGILMTATPDRSDGRIIKGFESEVLSETPTTVYKTTKSELPDHVNVQEYKAVKRIIRLKAHHETTFAEAWAEIPSPLCKIGRVPFDVILREVLGADIGDKKLLSELTPNEVRGCIGKVVRDGHVIREGGKRLVSAVRAFRRMEPLIGGMVLCGNDDDPEARTNEHANLIKACLNSTAGDLKVIIATSSDGNEGTDGKRLIEAFAREEQPEGDILIVKQMATVGLDCPRAKVCLDLSPVRTSAAFIQRLMRIATLYKFIKHGVYISPDDVIGRTLFSGLVGEAGGSASVGDLEFVKKYDKPKDEGPEKTSYLVSGTDLADFEDSNRNQAEKSRFAGVNFILDKFPELNVFMTHAEIAVRLGEAMFEVPEGVRDTSDESSCLRDDINNCVRVMTKVRVRATGLSYSPDLFRDTIREVWREVYRGAGVEAGRELKDVSDLQELQRIKAVAERMGEYSEVF